MQHMQDADQCVHGRHDMHHVQHADIRMRQAALDIASVEGVTSTVECMMRRVTCTGRVWPSRWARPTACCRMAGSIDGSSRKT